MGNGGRQMVKDYGGNLLPLELNERDFLFLIHCNPCYSSNKISDI